MDFKQEKALIEAAQHGDENAYAELYDAYFKSIYRYIFYRVNVRDVAEDLTSEVFVRVVEGLPSYVHRGVTFLAWLYRIARARLADYFKRLSRNGEPQDIDSMDLSVEEEALNERLMTTYFERIVQGALTGLSADQQQVLLLRFIEGYDVQTTADLLGKPAATVSVIQHRALQALNQGLKKRGISYDRS